jgi:hypothetical protein
MIAKFSSGDVLLTTGVGKVIGEILLSVVARDTVIRQALRKGVLAEISEFTRLSEGEQVLRVQSNGQFAKQSFGQLILRQPDRPGNGFRNRQA